MSYKNYTPEQLQAEFDRLRDQKVELEIENQYYLQKMIESPILPQHEWKKKKEIGHRISVVAFEMMKVRSALKAANITASQRLDSQDDNIDTRNAMQLLKWSYHFIKSNIELNDFDQEKLIPLNAIQTKLINHYGSKAITL